MGKLFLQRSMFTGAQRILAEHGALRAYAFSYDSGVEALRIVSLAGEITLLPFHGQQIWRATFQGHDLPMKSMFDEPTGSREFLETYGGFLLHCGLSGIGAPGPADAHAHHGELPNAAYDSAWLELGEDAGGRYMALGGRSLHRVGFTMGYAFCPTITLREESTTFTASVEIANQRSTPLAYAYLCHINFLPVDGARLVSSIDPRACIVHAADQPEALRHYADRLRKDLTEHEQVDASSQCYDPEICITLSYKPDADGLGHTMQYLPDGYAHYVAHPADALAMPVRWIARGGDEQAMGMVLPATCEHLGRANALAKGQLKTLGPHARVRFEMEVGLLPPDRAVSMERHIRAVLAKEG